MEENRPHVAILPSPGMGHLIPLAEFAKRLVLQHDFSVTFIALSAGVPSKEQKAYLDALPKSIRYHQLPSPNFDDVPADAKIETRICLSVLRSLPDIREVVKNLKETTRLTALVVDLFGTDAFDVAKEFELDPFIFFPTTAMSLSLFLHLPAIDQAISCEYRDMPEPLKLPGCVPIRPKDLLDPIQDRKNEAYSWLLHQARRYVQAKGIIINSFLDLEPGALNALKEEIPAVPPVYPVGPLLQSGSSSAAVGGDDSLKWLDEQPAGSVLFVSFGSGGTLSSEQMTELALGLEMSDQRFLWVVRSPNDAVTNASFFNSQSSKDPLAFLPAGFLDRTKGVGRVVSSWAPQVQILDHGSTGGFLSHCGWNSILESIVKDVPLIVWPLYAEQRMNAVMLVEDIKVAIRPELNEMRGLVERHEIARVVKALMEGEEGKKVRNRMRELNEAGAKVLAEGGSSYKALSEVASLWKNREHK
ncbi:hydroquinone glucosyltransferase [Aristolochia californica]|uniref:hydroquinone glucosyltransferase n=1 Tax=Aristolochia californica TaxID=171875 RepID=UPI0035D93AEA